MGRVGRKSETRRSHSGGLLSGDKGSCAWLWESAPEGYREEGIAAEDKNSVQGVGGSRCMVTVTGGGWRAKPGPELKPLISGRK